MTYRGAVHKSAAGRAGELRSRILGLCGAAVAVGLTAHLLSQPAGHPGSILDVALILIAACCLRVGGRSMRGTANGIMMVAASAAVTVFWPLLEPGHHGVDSESFTSLLWLLPVALAFIFSLSIFARESLAVIRAMIAIVGLRECARSHRRIVAETNAHGSVIDTLTAVICRRGPPAVELAISFST